MKSSAQIALSRFGATIDAVYPCVIPSAAVQAQPAMALPESPPGISLHHPPQALVHRRVPHGGVHRRRIPCRPGQSDDAAGATDREPMLRRQHLDGIATRGRRYRFRLSRSWMAAFSRASSAYIRFSFAFSVSSSFRRLSSATSVPAYFDRQLK